MTELSAAALEQLRILDTAGARQIPDTAEMQLLWDERYVMGDSYKAHITIRGQTFLGTYDKAARH